MQKRRSISCESCLTIILSAIMLIVLIFPVNVLADGDVQVDGTMSITGTPGGDGIIFPDSTKQTTAATSSVYQQRVTGTCPSGQAINQIYSGGSVNCQSVGTGTVTSVGTGSGLTGGTITSTGTISIASAGVTDSMLATGISASKISGNIPGNAASITGNITESQVTNLSTDLGNKVNKSGDTMTGLLTVPSFHSSGPGTFSDSSTNGTAIQGTANVGSNAWGVYGVSGDGIGVMGRSVSPSGFAGRFENLGSGKALGAAVNATEVMDVDASGVHAGPGMTPTPLAHGYFDASAGARMSGSSNITCSWSVSYLWYACTITGEYFFYQSYTVNVTPSSLAVPVIGSSSGQLLVTFFNLSGVQIKPSSGFSVTVYKQ